MKYLVIGGAGFIGCNFSDRLLARGDEVILMDNLSRQGTTINLGYLQGKFPEMRFSHADIRSDFERMKKEMENVDVVFHLAGQVAVTTSVADPREDFEINALGTFNILEAIRLSERKPCLIYASTNKVYGGMDDIVIEERNNQYVYRDYPEGISETRLLDFHSPYGCSKGAADQYVRDYARIYGLKTVVMRQSCIYGSRQFGIEDQGWVAWFTIASILNKQITIFGDGKQVRDVLYIDDLFDAWDLAVKNIERDTGEVFNIGGGVKYTMSLLELLGLLEELLKKKINVKYTDLRPGDQPVYVSDIAYAREKLGWKPKTDVREGLSKLAAWVKKNDYLFSKFWS